MGKAPSKSMENSEAALASTRPMQKHIVKLQNRQRKRLAPVLLGLGKGYIGTQYAKSKAKVFRKMTWSVSCVLCQARSNTRGGREAKLQAKPEINTAQEPAN